MSFLEHIQSKPTHERRGHSLRWAMGIVALIVLGWLVMLPVRFGSIIAQYDAQQNAADQTASAAQGTGNATLLVSTSTTYAQ